MNTPDESCTVTLQLSADLMQSIDRYVVINGVTRSAVIEAAMISFADAWKRSRLAIEAGK